MKARGLVERLEAREALVWVVGLGCVGLLMAAAFGEADFPVSGVDHTLSAKEAELLLDCYNALGHVNGGVVRL